MVLRQYLFNATADSDLVKLFMQLKLTLSAGNAFQILTTLELKSICEGLFEFSACRVCSRLVVSSGLSDSANSKEVRYFNFGDASNDFISKN